MCAFGPPRYRNSGSSARIGGGLGHRQRDTEDGVGAQPGLVRGAVEVQQRLIDQSLIVGVEPDDGRGDLVEHGLHGLLDALTAVAVAAVAQFDGLVLAGRRAGGHRGPCKCPVDQSHLDLDRRIAAGIEDLAGSDLLDNRHWFSLRREGYRLLRFP